MVIALFIFCVTLRLLAAGLILFFIVLWFCLVCPVWHCDTSAVHHGLFILSLVRFFLFRLCSVIVALTRFARTGSTLKAYGPFIWTKTVGNQEYGVT